MNLLTGGWLTAESLFADFGFSNEEWRRGWQYRVYQALKNNSRCETEIFQ
jgi:hypothetical protein